MKKLSVKGFADRIELVFTEPVSASEAEKELKALSAEEKTFFTEEKIAVSYCGLKLTYDEEMLFAKTVRKVFGKNARFIKQHKLSTEKIRYSLSHGEVICKVVEKSLRSGEEIFSEGDVLVMGDVNPGASIVAYGNITVLGALRGNACIRKSGKVYATYMSPAQIRIGKIYSYNKRPQNVGPAIALAENGEIILQCL